MAIPLGASLLSQLQDALPSVLASIRLESGFFPRWDLQGLSEPYFDDSQLPDLLFVLKLTWPGPLIFNSLLLRVLWMVVHCRQPQNRY